MTMFSPNQFDTLAQVARLHQQDLLREAEQQRRIAQSGLQVPSIGKIAAWWFGAALIGLGERLSAGQGRIVSQNRMTQNCA
jgi:hypothetical protein